MTQTFCKCVLARFDNSQAYPERVVRHLLLTLACEGMDQESSFALDTLAVVLWRYRGRIKADTMEALAECLGTADAETDTLVACCITHSQSLVAALNDAFLHPEKKTEIFCAQGKIYRDNLKLRSICKENNELLRWKHVRKCYAPALFLLRRYLKQIRTGCVSAWGTPGYVMRCLGKNDQVKYALRVPNLLLEPECLYTFLHDSIYNAVV